VDKLLVALCVFVSGSASVLAQAPTTPPNQSDDAPYLLPPGDYPTRFGDPGYDERKDAARAAAKAKWDKMTPEERTALKKSIANGRQKEPLMGDFGHPGGWAFESTLKEREVAAQKSAADMEKKLNDLRWLMTP
jgi:hypothetical protein